MLGLKKRCLGRYGKQNYLVCKSSTMIVNLQKNFSFNKDAALYEVDYLFSNKIKGDPITGLFLTLNISVNGSEKKEYKIDKPTATLYLSNEDIEKMIREEMVSL